MSRSADSCVAGKCTEQVRTVLPEATYEALHQLAAGSGMALGEYVRTVLLVHVHGQAHVMSLAAQRHNAMARIGQQEGAPGE